MTALYDHLFQGGVKAEFVFTMAASRYGKELAASSQVQQKALDHAGMSDEELLNEFGISIRNGTGAELFGYAFNGKAGRSGFGERFLGGGIPQGSPLFRQAGGGGGVGLPVGDAGTSYSIAPAAAKRDSEYMAAVEAGDVAKQQAMVDEAAKAAGYDIRGFHGTRSNDSFTEFTPNDALGGAIFIATERPEAEAFGRVMNVFIRAENVRKGIVRSYDEVRVIAKAKSKGQDAIRVTDGIGSPVNYAVFDPNQIKSADPFTGSPMPFGGEGNDPRGQRCSTKQIPR